MQLILALLMLVLLLGSCAEKDNAGPPETVPSDASTDAPDAGPGETAWPPIECAGLSSPFLEEGCLTKIHEVCRSHQDKLGCVGQGKVDAAGTYFVFCNWVPVVKFVDDVNCEVASSTWRCEAHIDLSLDICADPCEASPEQHFAWKAIASEREMIKMCGIPLGPWATVGAGWFHAASCLPGRLVTPPNPPLCNCIPQACEVTRGLMADQF